MKHFAILAAISAIVISGCGSKEEATPPTSTTGGASASNPTSSGIVAISYDKGSKKVGDKGVCAICMVKEGKQTAEEEVKVVLDYKDKTYVFCNESEEAEFISNPKKYTGN